MRYLSTIIILFAFVQTPSFAQYADSTEAAYYERMKAMQDSIQAVEYEMYQEYRAQLDTVPKFKIKPASWIGFNSPQKYGIEGFMYFGKFTEDSEYLGKYSSTYTGIRIGGGIYRGGYRYTVGYYKYESYIGYIGYSLNLSYLNNNSIARVRKGSELLGLQAEFTLMFQLRIGLFKDLNDDKIIPTFGFGIPIGPKMFDY